MSAVLSLLVVPALLVACGKPDDVPAVVAPTSERQPNTGCGRVTVASMNWHSAELLAQVDQFVLSRGYGCEVELVAGDTVPTITAMIETGQPDVSPETWIDAIRPPLQAAVDEGRLFLVARALQDGGSEGWWIPRHVAKAHPEIKTIDDALKRPDLFPAVPKPSPPASPAPHATAAPAAAGPKSGSSARSSSGSKGGATTAAASDPRTGAKSDAKAGAAASTASTARAGATSRAETSPANRPANNTTAGTTAGHTPRQGAVYSCPGSWTCHLSTLNAFKAWNAEKRGFVLVEPESVAQLDATLASVHETRFGWLGYHWSPTPAVGRYDLVRLAAGVPHDADTYQACMQALACENPARTDWPTSEVFTVVSQRLEEQGGPVWRYLNQRSWTQATVNGLLAWMTNNRASSEDTARHFLKTQPEVWRDWVSPEAAEKIATAL